MSDRSTKASEGQRSRTGVWLVGGRGAISTCVVYGLNGLTQGLVPSTGLVTANGPLANLPWRGLGDFVLGGSEVRAGDLGAPASELVREQVLPANLVAACSAEAAAYDARVAPGLLDAADVGLPDMDPEAARRGALAPREQVAAIKEDLKHFTEEAGCDRLVVVYLASTEAAHHPQDHWESMGALETALDAGQAQPASVLYAYAAFEAGAAFVNFTPNRGASPRALQELALERGLPHCGNDGKTGETLVKTALAPMFAHRALKVLSWAGYNMLGNRDGQVLSDPLHRESKVRNKDGVLRDLLPGDDLHSHVAIDYVPSLGDWKTAMDFVHFEGFFGTKMSLQFTWAGSDSALAAPLVIDLVRLADLALARGESGLMKHTAAFFKSPLSGGTHDFHAQSAVLLEYAQAVLGESR